MKNPLAVVRAVAAASLAATVGVWLGACSQRPIPEGDDAQAVGAPAPAAAAGPKLVIEQTDHDFGRMERGGTGRHEFVVANRGDRPLVLGRGKSSCGCCTCVCDAELPERGEVPPGASATVTLQWTIRRYTGKFHQSQTLATNDPQQPEVTLAVTGRITPTVRVMPAQLIFTRVPAGEPVSGEVRLYGYRPRALEITGHELSDPARAGDFEVTCEPLPADEVAAEPDAQSGCLVRVKVKPGLAAGPFRQHILLVTNLDSAAKVEIPVQGTVGSQLAVAGYGWEEHVGVLTLGTVAASKGTERRLYVIARGPHAAQVKLTPEEIVPDLMEVEVGEAKSLGNGAVFRIPLTIRIPPGSRAANYLGTKADELGRIVLRTGHPQQPELEILVRFSVKPDPE